MHPIDQLSLDAIRHRNLEDTGYESGDINDLEEGYRQADSDRADLLDYIDALTPRTITTREELDALPVATVLRDEVTAIWEKWESAAYGSKNWRQVGDDCHWTGNDIVLPATVLFTPTTVESGR